MATVNFYDDIFDTATLTKEIASQSVKSVVNDYLEHKDVVTELYECYNTETGKTEYISDTPNGYKVIIVVNGQEENLDYVITEMDVVSLIFIPQGEKFNTATSWTMSSLSILTGLAVVIGSGIALQPIGMAVGVGLMFAGATGVQSLLKNEIDSSYESPAEAKSIPYISGAENDLQLGNKYLYTMGRHLLAPRIIGTPWHETFTKDYKDARDNGQYINVLYCAGYGPLKLTDFKIGDTVLAYNKNSDSGDRQTVIHGRLKGCDETVEKADGSHEFIPGEITGKWKNNDVSIEILQAGSYLDALDMSSQKYGDIYKQAVAESVVDAKALFAYDKDLSDDTIVSIYGKGLPSGYRTNTVKFSASCPKKLEVELVLPQGMYATWNEKGSDEKNSPVYQNIPLWVAVQWRFSTPGGVSSDAESPVGWNTFSRMVFFDGEKNTYVYPAVYNDAVRGLELKSNKGLSKGTKKDFNNKWLGAPAFPLSSSGYGTEAASEEQIQEFVDKGYLTAERRLLKKKKVKKADWGNHWVKTLFQCNYAVEDEYNICYFKTATTPDYIDVHRTVIYGAVEVDGTKYDYEGMSTTVNIVVAKVDETKHKKDDFNIDERRYVFDYEFTDDECKMLAGIEGNVNDAVEVRVIRLTPCYINEAGVKESDNRSTYSYMDMVTWGYLRSFRFDKDAFKKACKINNKAKVEDYPLRPQPLVEDMDKFVYIALRMKQDPTNQAGQTLKKLNVISESFNPKFDYVEQKWYPEVSSIVYKSSNKDDGIYYEDKELTKVAIYPQTFAWTLSKDISASTTWHKDNHGKWSASTIKLPAGLDCRMTQDVQTALNSTFYRYEFSLNPQKKPVLKERVNGLDILEVSGVDNIYRYYHKHIDNKNVSVIEITKEEYEENAAISSETDIYYRNKCGNDFMEKIRDEVFSPDCIKLDRIRVYGENGDYCTRSSLLKDSYSYLSKVEPSDRARFIEVPGKTTFTVFKNSSDGKYYHWHLFGLYDKPCYIPSNASITHIIGDTYFVSMKTYEMLDEGMYDMLKYILPDSVAHKYISSNTASVFAGALLNNYLGSDAKTYENIDMDSLADAYEFYEDITDGTEQVYSIDPDYDTKACLTLSSRLKKKGERGDWEDESDYSTYLTAGCTNKDDTEALAYTVIRDNGSVISMNEARAIDNEFYNNGTIKSGYEDLILARFHGANCIATSDKYADILHRIGDLYYNYGDYYTEEDRASLILLMTKHINAVSFGLYKDVLENLMLTLEIDFADMKYVVKILEQMSLPGCQDKSKNWRNQPAVCLPSDGLQHVRFECNGVLDKDVKLETLIQKILLTGRSYVKRSDDNKYEPLIGKPNPYPVNILNQRNTISKSNSKSFEETPCGFQVSLLDENDGYETIDFYVMDKGEDEKDPTKKIEPFNIEYVTNKWQIRSLALFNLACRIYQQESYTRTVGIVGYSLSLGNTVLIQDDSLLIGTDNGARIMELIEDNDYIYGFVTDEPFDYRGELDDKTGKCKQGCSIVQANKSGRHRCVTIGFKIPDEPVYVPREKLAQLFNPLKEYYVFNGTEYEKALILSAEDFDNGVYSTVSGFNDPNATFFYKISMKKGITNVCLFASKVNKNSEILDDYKGGDIYFYKPAVDDLVAFGEINSITSKAVIMSIKPNGRGQFDLSLVPYNEKLYNAGQGIPIFTSNMTNFQSEDDYAFNTDVTLSQIQEMTASNIALAEGYNVMASSDNVFFAVDSDGIVLKRQVYEVKYMATRGQRVLTAVRPDVIPGVGEFRINLPSEDIDKFSIEIKPNHYDTLVITADVGANLTSLSDVDIILNCEGIEVNTESGE